MGDSTTHGAPRTLHHRRPGTASMVDNMSTGLLVAMALFDGPGCGHLRAELHIKAITKPDHRTAQDGQDCKSTLVGRDGRADCARLVLSVH